MAQDRVKLEERGHWKPIPLKGQVIRESITGLLVPVDSLEGRLELRRRARERVK